MKAFIISFLVLSALAYATLIVFVANNYALDKRNQQYQDSLLKSKHHEKNKTYR